MDDEVCDTCEFSGYNLDGIFLGCFRQDLPKNAPTVWPEVDTDDVCDEWSGD